MLQEVPATLSFSVPSHLLMAVAAKSLIVFWRGGGVGGVAQVLYNHRVNDLRGLQDSHV